MLCKIERQRGGASTLRSISQHEEYRMSDNVLADIDGIIESLQEPLWLLNKFIHKNPELAFEEYKAHDALTNYMQPHEDWKITRSAYGLDTAWVALYDSGKPGPVVSFNAEMGMSSNLSQKKTNIH
jgi:hypothetical protein